MSKTRILVVDDEETIRNLLQSRLTREGHEVMVAASAEEAEAKFKDNLTPFGVMITDLKMPGKDGLTLMESLKTFHPRLRVIMITGHGEKDVAVRALRQGASDYLEKPFDLDELSHAVNRCVRERQLEKENEDLLDRLEARVKRVEGKSEDKYWYVSKAKSMAKVNDWLTILRREAMRGSAEEPTVLILGESGSGKEGIARMVHAGSRRGNGPWVAVNCANFNEQLLESELFGHERGAFTGANAQKRGLFELARGGTLFLDEIGEMDIKLQAKLLRVLQEKVFRRVGGVSDIEADVRIVAATNRNLDKQVSDGRFRDDLYHRLNRVVVELPALRERFEDIVPMARQFAEQSFRSRGKTFFGFMPEAEDMLRNYNWPGNVREMLNVIERAALLCDETGPISAHVLSLPVEKKSGGGFKMKVVESSPAGEHAQDFESFMRIKKKWVDAFEREYLMAVVERNAGNISCAAREAKMDRSNFLRLMRRHNMNPKDFRIRKAA
jgi:DNA-binding NtrC family response regulator